MRRPVIILAVLLVGQLLLALGLYRYEQPQTSATRQKLLSVKSADVDEIDIRAVDTDPLVLKKIDAVWRLPNYADALADAQRINRLLNQLTDLQRPWPVAGSEGAGKRFRVDEQNYEQRLELRKEGRPLATLLLGGSPGFNRIYARVSGEKKIYEIPFSSYQASAKPEDWIDRNLLKFELNEVAAITLPDCRLERNGDTLQLTSMPQGKQTREDRVGQLLDVLSNLSVQDLYQGAGGAMPTSATLKIDVSFSDGAVRSYGLAEGDKSGYDLLKVSGFDNVFKVRSGLMTDLEQYTEQTLLKSVSDDPDGKAVPTDGVGKKS
jgi:hypothetical protein